MGPVSVQSMYYLLKMSGFLRERLSMPWLSPENILYLMERQTTDTAPTAAAPVCLFLLRKRNACQQKNYGQEKEIENQLPDVFHPAVVGDVTKSQRAHNHRRRGGDEIHES